MNPDDSTIFPSKLRTLRGDEARVLLETQIAEHNGGLLSTLAKYRADTVRVWHDTIRAIEECVSAWNKDPVFGVIGIQSGPRDKGPQWLPSSHG
ncbi:hypothetical protein, partial [Bradyrhizobium liaoningense]|uniref:hypothetical protein n=1 Tax=Bradyrhizobium liaoningense TaxID=43992 RepID=UPI001BA8608D